MSPDKSLLESPTKSAKKKRRRRQTSEGSVDGENIETVTKHRKLDFENKELDTDTSNHENESVKQELNVLRNDEGEEKDAARKKKKKRKKSKGEGQTSVTESETSDQLSVEESDRESRKRKLCDTADGDSEPPSKIAEGEKVSENKENAKTTATGEENKCSETDVNKEKKKRKTRSHKSKLKDKDIPELRVISK